MAKGIIYLFFSFLFILFCPSLLFILFFPSQRFLEEKKQKRTKASIETEHHQAMGDISTDSKWGSDEYVGWDCEEDAVVSNIQCPPPRSPFHHLEPVLPQPGDCCPSH